MAPSPPSCLENRQECLAAFEEPWRSSRLGGSTVCTLYYSIVQNSTLPEKRHLSAFCGMMLLIVSKATLSANTPCGAHVYANHR